MSEKDNDLLDEKLCVFSFPSICPVYQMVNIKAIFFSCKLVTCVYMEGKDYLTWDGEVQVSDELKWIAFTAD